MPRWLKELEKTSLLFWSDPDSLTWGQAIALLVSTSSLYLAARAPFAGEETLVSWNVVPILIEVVVALLLVLGAGHLGKLERVGPNLVRLLAVHLNVTMALLATNLVWRWGNLLPNFQSVAAMSCVIVTALLLWKTWRRDRPKRAEAGKGHAVLGVTVSAIVVTLVNGVLVFYCVLPKQ